MTRLFRRRRGRVTALLIALTAVFVVGLEKRYTTPALALSPGDPYHPPEIVDTNPDSHIVETTIIAEPAAIDIGGGRIASVLTYNGTIPGPIFRLHVGDTVIVHFENHIAHNTGIHWHGIELENASDGTPLTQNQVPPGGKFLYKFKVPRAGIYWYHPHHHSSTNQVFKGLYGEIIVEDPNEPSLIAAGTIPDASHTLALGLSDITVCQNVGSNDATMFDTSGALPWVGNPATGLTANQPNPTSPISLCQDAADGGSARDEDGNPRSTSFTDGDVPNTQPPGNPGSVSGPVNEGQVVVTNGVNVGARGGNPHDPAHPLLPDPVGGASIHTVQAGQGLRLQVGSTATTRFFRLRLTDDHGNKINLYRIGGQGGLLDNPRLEGSTSADPSPPVGEFDTLIESGEILLDPGDRADIVVPIPAAASGILTLWTLDTRRSGAGYSKLPTVPVAHFQVSGAVTPYTISTLTALRPVTGPVETLGAPTVSLLDPSTFSPAKPGMLNQDIQLTNASMILGINGVQGAHDVSGDYTGALHEGSSRFAASLGDTLELTVTNTTPSAHHPFHLHGFSMQPITLTKASSPTFTYPHEFKDNVDIPPGYTLKFRIRLDDRPLIDGVTMGGGMGRWVFHCHIFFHATFGMISEFVVSAADGKERPYVNANDVAVQGHVGDALTMHGKYVDTDGEAVTLAASIGSVSDDGGGNWTWTYTAAGGEDPFVYITGTDAGGRKDQAAFGLNVNRPPVLTVPGPQTEDYHDALSFGISATDPDGDPITLTVSGLPASLNFVDNGSGTGSVTGTLTVIPGVYTATFSASDGINAAVKKDVIITVTKEETALAYTGPTVILNGGNVTLSASLKEDGIVPISGRNVDFTFGAQACSGSTLPSGVASCTIAAASVLGSAIPITATFTGDAFYLPSSSSATAVVFAFPPGGTFVVGDTSAAGGGTVTWWDSSWAKANTFSDGTAASAMKGFAPGAPVPTSTPPPACGGAWSTTGGTSPPPPPSGIPSFMGVFTTNSAVKSGTAISGNTVSIIVVQVDPGYAPNSGGLGTGTVIATFCHQ